MHVAIMLTLAQHVNASDTDCTATTVLLHLGCYDCAATGVQPLLDAVVYYMPAPTDVEAIKVCHDDTGDYDAFDNRAVAIPDSHIDM